MYDACTLLAAGFCERGPATHEREGLAGGLRASVWLFKEKKLDANGEYLRGFALRKLLSNTLLPEVKMGGFENEN